MGEWYYALQLGEAEGVRVRTCVMGVVTAFAVVTVFMGRAVPNHMHGLDLFTEVTAMRKGEGSVRVASL